MAAMVSVSMSPGLNSTMPGFWTCPSTVTAVLEISLLMQTTENRNLPKRSRYYQGMIDLNLIERGADYSELKKSYVIFICPFDAFEAGLHKYTFESICKELPQINLGDEATKIFLCASGDADDVSSDMKDFLDWLSGKQGRSRLVGKLENAVQKVKDHKEWRTEYMTLLMRDQEMMRKGR